MVSAVFLGLFFAMQSGTLDSLVYDTVLEETGDSESFERTIGRLPARRERRHWSRARSAAACIAQFLPLQVTYFLTAPLLLAAARSCSLVPGTPAAQGGRSRSRSRSQLGVDLPHHPAAGGGLRLVIVLTVVGALLVQGMLEFGPLWLVAFAVPAVPVRPALGGPHRARSAWVGCSARRRG